MALTKGNFYKKPNFTIETSFDDGYKLDLKVAELLKRYKIKGTFYLVLDWIGTKDYLSWDDIKWLDKEGFTIGSHTITHPQDLKALYDEQLHYEIQNSKDLLETALGHKITTFCYPRGRADERVKEKVIEAGYINARGTGKVGVTEIKDKFYLPGTIHIFQRREYDGVSIFDYAKRVLDKIVKDGGYCNIWGHSREMARDNTFNVLEQILKYIQDNGYYRKDYDNV